jgi:DNA-binding NtrC family response regulator
MDTSHGSASVPAPKTVLVVDDDDYVRDLIVDYLRARGLEAVEAQNGLEALLKYRQARPQAVVLDILMPRLGGLRALQRIRSLDQGTAVIVVTGAMDTELRRQVLASGATAILTKPIHLKDLWAALGGPDGWAEEPETVPATPPPPFLKTTSVLGARVLVVDDDPGVRSLLEHVLARHGYDVRSVADGQTALRAIREDSPEAVLLDVNLPGLSGVEALEAVHAITPGVKVIMISGAASFEAAKDTLARGAFDFVAKPFDMKALAHTLHEAVLMKRLEADWNVEPGG